MNIRLFFDHVQKTGGTAIAHALTQYLGESNVATSLFLPASVALKRYCDKALISGHFTFAKRGDLDAGRYTHTVVRHPVDRIISFYHYCKNDVVPGRQIDALVEQAKLLTFEEFIFSENIVVRRLLENSQVQHFSPLERDGTSYVTESGSLELAKQALKQFSLVGAYEEIGDFLDVLACDLGIPPIDQIQRINVTSRRPTLSAVSPGIRKHLEKLNQQDIELYEFALGLFRAKRKDVLRQHAVGQTHTACAIDNQSQIDFVVPGEGQSLSNAEVEPANYGNRRIELVSATITGDASDGEEISSGEMVCLHLDYRAHQSADKIIVGFRISDDKGQTVFGTNSQELGFEINVKEPGDYYADFNFRCDLGRGKYLVTAAIHSDVDITNPIFHWQDEIASFRIVANIGYQWEGVAKLYPSFKTKSLRALSPPGLSNIDVSNDCRSVQHIAVDTPKLSEFNATIIVLGSVERLLPNAIVAIELEVHNSSNQLWSSVGLFPVRVSYHWLDDSGQVVVYDGARTPLPGDVLPNGKIRLWATVKAPPSGYYYLVLTLLQEGVAWFDMQGCDVTKIFVCVAEPV
jgi:hypothetical protein